MQIINPMGRPDRDLKPLLRVLAGSGDRLEAARGEKFLELLRYLEAQGPTPCVAGVLVGRDLWLLPPAPSSEVSVRVWVDWPDYGPVQDGLPVMHYRIQVKRPSPPLSTDHRVRSPEEAEQALLEAFNWKR